MKRLKEVDTNRGCLGVTVAICTLIVTAIALYTFITGNSHLPPEALAWLSSLGQSHTTPAPTHVLSNPTPTPTPTPVAINKAASPSQDAISYENFWTWIWWVGSGTMVALLVGIVGGSIEISIARGKADRREDAFNMGCGLLMFGWIPSLAGGFLSSLFLLFNSSGFVLSIIIAALFSLVILGVLEYFGLQDVYRKMKSKPGEGDESKEALG